MAIDKQTQKTTKQGDDETCPVGKNKQFCSYAGQTVLHQTILFRILELILWEKTRENNHKLCTAQNKLFTT